MHIFLIDVFEIAVIVTLVPYLRSVQVTGTAIERPQSRDLVKALQFVTLVKMYRLLWVAVPLLAAIAFPSIRGYMGIVAIVLMIDVLWRCWATRKVGQHD